MSRRTLVNYSLTPVLFCFGLVLFYLYDYHLRLLPSLVDKGISGAYHLGDYAYSNLYALYYFAYIPLQLVAGLLVDRYSATRLIAMALLFSSTGCYFFGNATALWLAEIGRVMMGVGVSFIFISTLKSISLRLPSRHFTFFLGAMVGIGMLGLLASDFIMTFFLRQWGWRLVCYLSALLGVLLILVNYSYYFSGIRCYQFVNKRFTWRHDIKQLMDYLKDSRLLIRCAIGILLYMPIICFTEVWGGRFLSHSYQFSATVTSVDLAMLILGFAIGAPLLGWLHDKTHESQLILMVGSVAATILLSVILCVPDLSAFKVGVFLFFLGVFLSSVLAIFALNRQLASYQNLGKVFGVTNFLMMFSGIGALIVSGLLKVIEQNALIKLLPFYASSTYQLALLFLPCATLLAVFLTFYARDA